MRKRKKKIQTLHFSCKANLDYSKYYSFAFVLTYENLAREGISLFELMCIS